MTRSQVALLVAFGVDNVGSGLFLPLALVYATQAVGLPIGIAGAAVAAGPVVGLVVPPIAGRMVDRVGPRAVVVTAQLVQACGALGYLLAHGVGMIAVGAILLSSGQQAFYCAMFPLIAEKSDDGPKETPFARVGMVRSACFGLGSLAAGGLLTWAGPVGYPVTVAADGASFLVCAALLLVLVEPSRRRHSGEVEAKPTTGRGPIRDRTYLTLTGITMLGVLAVDFFLVGEPVYILEQLHGPTWLPGAVLALYTIAESLAGTTAVRLTRRFARTSTMACGAALFAVWSMASLAATLVPSPWRTAWLLGTTVIPISASLLFMTRTMALAESLAPPPQRGRYLATFQYAFTIAQILAPAAVGLFATGIWAPWLLVALCAALAASGLHWIKPRLPATATTPTREALANT